jgi:hypothetical protein
MMRISPETARTLAIVASLVALGSAMLAVAFGIVLFTDSSYTPAQSLGGTLPDIVMPLNFAMVGSVIAIKRPGNLVGWSMLLSGVGWLAGDVIGAYAELAVLAKPEVGLPLGAEAAAVSASLWTPLMAGIFLLVLLFPSGEVPSRRWRPVTFLVLLGFTYITVGLSTAPVGAGDWEPPFDYLESNPLSFVDSDLYLIPVFAVIACCLACIVAAAIDLFVRFWRSRGEERQQFKWLAFSAAILAASIPFAGTSGFGILPSVSNVTFGIGLFSLPIAVGVAVLRYRLYDIDRIISRTLAYAVLTAGLVATYLALVVGLQALLRPLNDGSDLAIVGTTLIVAALFLPARQRVQDAVDRRFNRRAYDAARTVDAFGARLREQIDLDTLRYEMLAVVDETMQPAKASLWLRPGGPR